MKPQRLLMALVCGLLFGAGLTVSDMINPARVLAFLDVTGDFDPSATIVFAAALVPSTLAYRQAQRRRAPVLDTAFHLPGNTRIDARLLLGAALFGMGWGLSGFCPGPVVAALSTGRGDVILFAVAVLAGMGLFGLLPDPAAPAPATRPEPGTPLPPSP